MALLGFAPEQVRPTALALNLLVGGIGLFRWWRGGHVRWRNVLPFVLASAPAAFLSAQVTLPKESYSLLLGIVLLVAAVGVFRHASRAEAEDQASSGHTVPSSRWPNQPPIAKAASIIMKPLRADATPAACGNGPTAPLCPQGWWMPWPTMNK